MMSHTKSDDQESGNVVLRSRSKEKRERNHETVR